MTAKKKPPTLSALGDIRKEPRTEPVEVKTKTRKGPEPVVQLGTRVSVTSYEALQNYAEREGVTVRQAVEEAISRL